MRRPKRTREQREYDKVKRRLDALARAAVRLSVAEDDDYTLALTDLATAAQSYAMSLPRSELRRMVK